jgi:hypothetical protein
MGIVSTACSSLKTLLSGETGLSWAMARNHQLVNDQPIEICEVRNEHVSTDISERAPIRYPVIMIYCERLTNTQREKFTTLSGVAHLVAELRASGNTVAAVRDQTITLAEAIMTVLDCHKGVWHSSIQYCGGYEASFQPIKKGGTQLLQVTKIIVPVQLHQR